MLGRYLLMSVLLMSAIKLKQQNIKKFDLINSHIKQRHRVLPHDMGWRDHLPNYRYLSFIELNITKWLVKTQYSQTNQHHNPNDEQHKQLRWIISMQEVIYLKKITLFNKFLLDTKLAGWDKKYVYFEHRFMIAGQLAATGMTKVLLFTGKKPLLPEQLGLIDEQTNSTIDSWNQHQQIIKAQAN